MATTLPDMSQIGSNIQQRLTNLESQTKTNASNLSSLESQIIAVCNDIASGTQTTYVNNLSEEN
nr:MAG TPA: hypothetical protein [Caudoviricetes sp.]